MRFNWFRLATRLRYWKRRALGAESAQVVDRERFNVVVAALRDELRDEIERNREREDTFVSASVMGSRQMFGVPPRGQVRRAAPTPTPTYSTDPFDALPYADKHEFDLFWKADAEASGVPLKQAQQQFLTELANRRQPLNDDYSQ